MALLRRISLIVTSMAAVAVGVVVPMTASYAGAAAPAPQLTAPTNSTEIAVKDLVLKWRPVAGASSYEVQISRNIDFTNGRVALPADGQTVATVYEVPIGLSHATYYWRVRAIVNNAPGHWSTPWKFLREWEDLIHVVHVPSATDPTLSWAPVKDASEYHVIFDTSPIDPADLLDSKGPGCFTHNTSFTPGWGGVVGVLKGGSLKCDNPVLADKTSYYWGIAAFDGTSATELIINDQAAGGCGTELPECDASFVQGGPFTYTGATGGLTQQLTGLSTSWHADTDAQNACDAVTPCPMTPTFSWTPVNGASLYFTSVYLDRDATSVYREYVTQTPKFTPPDQFQDAQPGRPYYWQVQAATCGGTGVQCSPPAAASQGCPAPTTPASNGAFRPAATTSPAPTATPTLTGVSVSPPGPEGDQSMQGGTIRTVTVTGTNIVTGACALASGGVVTTVPSVTAGGMTFSYWAPVDGGPVTFRVENPDGTTSTQSEAINVDSSAANVALSAISSFQKRSGPVNLVSPADGATRRGSTVTFKWSDYIAHGSQGTYDPASYTLEVSTDRNFTTTVPGFPVTGIDLTQYTPTTSSLTDGHYFWRVEPVDESGNQLTWSAPRELILNSTRPTAQLTATQGADVNKPLSITFSHIVKGVNSRTVKVIPDGKSTSHAVPGKIRLGGSALQYTFRPKHPLATGGTYDLHVSRKVRDPNGNRVVVTGGPVRVSLLAHNDSKGWHYSRGWTRHAASGAISGSYVQAARGHQARLHIAGSAMSITGCKGPGFGSISISVAGRTHHVNEHQAFTRCGVVLWTQAIPSGIHTVRVVVTRGTGNLDAAAAV